MGLIIIRINASIRTQFAEFSKVTCVQVAVRKIKNSQPGTTLRSDGEDTISSQGRFVANMERQSRYLTASAQTYLGDSIMPAPNRADDLHSLLRSNSKNYLFVPATSDAEGYRNALLWRQHRCGKVQFPVRLCIARDRTS